LQTRARLGTGTEEAYSLLRGRQVWSSRGPPPPCYSRGVRFSAVSIRSCPHPSPAPRRHVKK